jgi:hypothetical protein
MSCHCQPNLFDADKLAEQFLSQHDNLQHTTAHIFLAGGCFLQSPAGTISDDHKKQLQLAQTEPPLRTRLCLGFARNDDTFDDVAWSCHGRALQHHLKHKTVQSTTTGLQFNLACALLPQHNTP